MFVLVLSSYIGYAQNGSITGRIMDKASGEKLEYATITLFTVSDSSLVTGNISDAKGRFNLSNLKDGNYFLKVGFIGYKDVILKDLKINETNSTIDLGSIKITESAEKLSTFEIEETIDVVDNKIDRKVYKVEKMGVTEGGTVDDVLEVIPSVEVDIDGNVSLRGSQNVTILMDGKPTGVSGEDLQSYLESLPANSIENVEVITNPSAKFDPDGMAGIINIITKRNVLEGMHGNINVNGGIGNGNKRIGSTSGMFSLKTGKWNLMLNYGFNWREQLREGRTFRENRFADSLSILKQNNEGEGISKSGRVKIGADYYLNDKNTISFGTSYNLRGRSRTDSVFYHNEDHLGGPLGDYHRLTTDDGAHTHISTDLDYKHLFDKEGHELTLGAGYRLFDGTFNGDYVEVPHFQRVPANYYSLQQRTSTLPLSGTYTLQLDYIRPLAKNNMLELGYKSIIGNSSSDFFSESIDTISNDWQDDLHLINHFKREQQIHSLYAVYKQNIKKFGYQFGLRGEQAVMTSELINTGETFRNEYLSLFPTIHMSYMLPQKQQLKASYSRRLNRPHGRLLNPFTNFSDPQNIRVGNPFLLPEYIDSYEIEYEKVWKKTSVTSSVYYKQINDMITRLKRVERGISTTSFQNLGTARNYGLEVILNTKISKWWSLMLSSNLYQTELEGDEENSELNASGYAYSIKALSTWYLPKDVSIQLSSRYNSPKVLAQGEISEMHYSDISIRKKVLKRKGTVSLKVTDVLNTREYQFITQGPTFFQDSFRKRHSRFIQIGFSYSFGKFQMKSRGGDRGRSGGDEMYSREID